MQGVAKHILIYILVLAFVYIAYISVYPEDKTEGFGPGVYYAKDCTCDPGFLPQLCGDPSNITKEQEGGPCGKNTYFCQSLTKPTKRTSCRN
jgi:hypothetical protein